MTTDFKTHLQDQNNAAVRLTCILCAILMPAGITLDLFSNRQFVLEFLILRLLASAVSLGVLALARVERLRKYSYVMITSVILACTGSIEIMIIRLGDPAGSPYYAGLNLCILGSGLVYVWSAQKTLLVCLLVLFMWMIPAVLSTPPLYGAAFNNFYFLSLTSIIAVAANKMRYDLAQREWVAQTQLSRTSAELRTSIARIQELDRLKNQFFANISHELRTPLALITVPIEEMLSARDISEKHKNKLQVVLRNGFRLHRLIDGLLDLARLESGQLRLRIGSVDLPELLRDTVGAFQPAAESLGIQISLSVADTITAQPLLGDRDKLEVVFTNLLGNALKFTERGGKISVEAKAVEGAVEIEFSDTGIGIAEDELPHIFERFRRVESESRTQGGAGIGLALVKELCELHGGIVTVRSEKGKGSTFTIRLCLGSAHFQTKDLETSSKPSIPPATDPGKAGAPFHALVHLDGVPGPKLEPAYKGDSSQAIPVLASGGGQGRAHVLVAEDNADLRRFLEELLSPYYSVKTASDGKEALDSIQMSPPDLVVADVMMPEMSGIELCQKLKRDVRLQTLPVILLTARSGLDETLEGFGHGADDYVAKPFRPRELLMRIAVHLKIRRLSAQVANAARLAAVGTLAAGVAHEVKNPLSAIGNGLGALRRRTDLSPQFTEEILKVCLECVERISSILNALTEHARPADGEELSLFDVSAGLESTLRLLSESIRNKQLVVTKEFHTHRPIAARPRQLNQVFLNLLDNAIRASPIGGHLFLTLTETDRDTISLVVRDEGTGIPLDEQDRIFDPFFTTREPGEGTGLGLYLSRKILESHEGSLRVASRPGQGASFLLELPCTTPPALALERKGLAESRRAP